MTISIVLVDDHAILRQGLRALLASEPDFRIVGETDNGHEALRLIFTLQPDVLLLDLEMPGMNGMEVAREISQQGLHTRIVILSMHAREDYVVEALNNGACAYVLKGSDAQALIHAIRQVMQGMNYLSPPITEEAIQAFKQQIREQTLDRLDTLTKRQHQVFLLVAKGLSSPQIGNRLGISDRTAEAHRQEVLHKLGLHNQAELIHYAYGKGILPVEDQKQKYSPGLK